MKCENMCKDGVCSVVQTVLQVFQYSEWGRWVGGLWGQSPVGVGVYSHVVCICSDCIWEGLKCEEMQ